MNNAARAQLAPSESAQSHRAAPSADTARSVLVTGGSRGIGRAVAERFLAEGHRVATTSRSGQAPTGALGIQCDTTDSAQVEAAFSELERAHGSIEVVVANAGITRDKLMLQMSDEDWQDVIDTNLTGAFRVAKRAIRSMIRKRFGRIIFISSVVGLRGSAGQVNYAASKSGLIGLARSLARETASRGITANVVAPGFIETDMTADLSEEVVTAYERQTPLGRFGTASEVTSAVEFLAGDGASYITGAVIPVDGGLGMGH